MKVGDAIPLPCLPPPASRPPRHMKPPPGSWDTHTHIIGMPPEFPWVSPRNYDPPAASIAQYAAHLDALGMTYGVLVQISIHGTDNSALVQALEAHPGRFRGIAVVAPDVSEAELERLHRAGVRGVRVVTLVAGGVGLETIAPLAERIAPLGWHLQLAVPGSALDDATPLLTDLPVPLVLDHFGGCDPADGLDGPQFGAMMRLVREMGCYVKLSAPYRLSAHPWDAVTPMAQALIAAAPDRMLWASDWPHVAITDPAAMPPTEDTLDVLARWTDDAAMQRRILVDNPAQLYGIPDAELGKSFR